MGQRTNKTQQNKKALLEALEEHLGIITDACKAVGLNRSTYYDYYNNDPEFKEEVDAIENVAIDFVESKLFERIKAADTTAIIFYLKTKAKKRGYTERHEFTGPDGAPIGHKFEGFNFLPGYYGSDEEQDQQAAS